MRAIAIPPPARLCRSALNWGHSEQHTAPFEHQLVPRASICARLKPPDRSNTACDTHGVCLLLHVEPGLPFVQARVALHACACVCFASAALSSFVRLPGRRDGDRVRFLPLNDVAEHSWFKASLAIGRAPSPRRAGGARNTLGILAVSLIASLLLAVRAAAARARTRHSRRCNWSHARASKHGTLTHMHAHAHALAHRAAIPPGPPALRWKRMRRAPRSYVSCPRRLAGTERRLTRTPGSSCLRVWP